MTQAYPLAWPQGRPRRRPQARKPGKFGKATWREGYGGNRYSTKGELSVADATRRLQDELDRLGARLPVISSNVELRLDGLPRSGQREPEDPGVCVYFQLAGKPHAMPCDTYLRVADNPALRPKLLRTGEGHRPWEEEEIAAFRATWAPETVERVAFELALNTGQRGGDLVAMLRQRYRRGAIQVKQEKTGELVEIPAADDLVAVLEPWLAAHDHLVVLATPSGGAFKVDHFRHTMRDAYSAAGLPASCTTHGLRYTAAARLRELGLDWPTIGAITGHATAEMVRKYSEKKRRARLAVGRLNRSQREQAKDAAG